MPVCFLCTLTVPSITALHSHFKIFHNLRPNDSFVFRCSEGDGCTCSYSGWKAFRVHLLKQHNAPQVQAASQNTLLENVDGPIEVCAATSAAAVDQPPADVSNPQPSSAKKPLNIPEIFEGMVIEFAAKLYSNHNVPRSHVVEIMKDTSALLRSMVDLLKSEREESIACLPSDKVCALVDKQLESIVISFKNLSTEHLYLNALKRRDLFISKHTYTIGSKYVRKRKRGKMVRLLQNVRAKFIPMRTVLQKVFSLPGVFSSVSAHLARLYAENQVIENFVQCNLWKKKLKHFEGKIVFPLFLYFDDFEVNNPLGSHAKVSKLGGVYYSIPCFPPEVGSLLENIFVAALFYSGDRVEFQNHSTFSEIIKELNFLQSEGVSIDTGCGYQRVYFALGLVLGDNLGLNQILGFQEGFSAIYSCRFCKTSKFDRQWETSETNLRSREIYESDVSEINPKNTGVKELSVWDKVQYFETSSNFAVDFLHDGPEGIFKKCMELIVNYFACQFPLTKDFFLRVLNDNLQGFDCCANDISNRPPLVSAEEALAKHLKMSASEMQNFILLFPMLVGHVVPKDNEVWMFYLKIRKVMAIAMAPRTRPDHVALLKVNVSEMYECYLAVFPNENVPPKLHMWVHYSRVLAESGPIIHLSTFRFEAKHQHKKCEARATRSRMDITETLTIKELHCLAYRFILGVGFKPNNYFGRSSSVRRLSDIRGFASFKLSCPNSFFTFCRRLASVTTNGISYKVKSCVALRLDGIDEVHPTFGLVSTILKDRQGFVVLVCHVLYTKALDHDFEAYEVEKTNSYECVSVNDLLIPSLAIYADFNNSSYVTLRYAI